MSQLHELPSPFWKTVWDTAIMSQGTHVLTIIVMHVCTAKTENIHCSIVYVRAIVTLYRQVWLIWEYNLSNFGHNSIYWQYCIIEISSASHWHPLQSIGCSFWSLLAPFCYGVPSTGFGNFWCQVKSVSFVCCKTLWIPLRYQSAQTHFQTFWRTAWVFHWSGGGMTVRLSARCCWQGSSSNAVDVNRFFGPTRFPPTKHLPLSEYLGRCGVYHDMAWRNTVHVLRCCVLEHAKSGDPWTYHPKILSGWAFSGVNPLSCANPYVISRWSTYAHTVPICDSLTLQGTAHHVLWFYDNVVVYVTKAFVLISFWRGLQGRLCLQAPCRSTQALFGHIAGYCLHWMSALYGTGNPAGALKLDPYLSHMA